MNKCVSVLLNNSTSLKYQIVPEEYIVESIRSLFFHLSPSPFISFCDGCFLLDPNIATKNYTAKLVQGIVRIPLQASKTLYLVKSFVFKTPDSAIQSLLQEGFQTYIIKPFYEELEIFHPRTLMELLFKGKHMFNYLKNALRVINSTNQVEMVFILAESGCEQMMMISIMLLKLFSYYCKDIILNQESVLLSVKGFFINKKDNCITYSNVPSIIPIDFVEDIVIAAQSNTIRSEISYSDMMNYSLTDLNESHNLPNVCYNESTDEVISKFKANAWKISNVPNNNFKKEAKNEFVSLHKAVESILLNPLWKMAKEIQKDTVNYILYKQKLLDVIKILSYLYLMKRGDLHQLYISNYCSFDKVKVYFLRYLKPIPFFKYKFISPNSISVNIPLKLRNIITQDHIDIYNQFFQYTYKIKLLLYELNTMKANKSNCWIRMQMIHFLTNIYQITISYVECKMNELNHKLKESETFVDLISNHSKFIKHLQKAFFFIFEDISKEIRLIFELCNAFINKHNTNNKKIQQQFLLYKTHLKELITTHSKIPIEISSYLMYML